MTAGRLSGFVHNQPWPLLASKPSDKSSSKFGSKFGNTAFSRCDLCFLLSFF
jgi:hypothetical protein